MSHEFCDHLDTYGVQYTRTEASYRQCVSLVDRVMAEGPRPDLLVLVTKALQEWCGDDQKLREMLVDEVKAGRVRIPLGIIDNEESSAGRKRREARNTGHPVCAECRFVVPRLAYPEWKFAHNGTPTFRGVEFPLMVPAAV
jgi:hypothetical protein